MNFPYVLFAAAAPAVTAGGNSGMSLTYVWDKATGEAKVIIIILGIFSIFAWATMVQKAIQMRRAKKLNRHFEDEFRGQPKVLGIFDRRLQVDGCPLFSVYQDGCVELDARLKVGQPVRREHLTLKSMEHIKRVLEGAVARECLRLESGLVLLSIAVSGAPFLGLLGTVWGVMDAFAGIARAAALGQQADLSAMAPGVAAALVTTVAGLLVAIPSMFGYNWLVHTLRTLTVELDNFAQSLVSRMETEFLKDDE